MYVIALLCPPLALLIYKRWFQFIPNLILWLRADEIQGLVQEALKMPDSVKARLRPIMLRT